MGILFAITSTATWALCSIILKQLGEKLDAVGMATVKSIISSIVIFGLLVLSGTNFIISKEIIFPIMLSGLLGIAIGDSFFFASLNKLSPLVLSLILFVGPDIFSGILGLICLGEIPSLVEWTAIILILLGLSCFIFPIKQQQNETKQKTTMLGLTFAIASLFCTAYSMVIIKPVLVDNSTLTVTMYRMLCSGFFLLVFGIHTKKIQIWKQALRDKTYNIKLIATIILATFGGFYLSLEAIKKLDLIIASTLFSLEPLFILIFLIILYKHVPKKKEFVGTLVIIIGILLFFWK